jgi:putative membrane protein
MDTMKCRKIHLHCDIIEPGCFIWLGILLIGIVMQNLTRFFVVHRMKPFILMTGFCFLIWGLKGLFQLCADENTIPENYEPCHDTGHYFQLCSIMLLVVVSSIAILQYRITGVQHNAAQAKESAYAWQNQIQHFSDGNYPNSTQSGDNPDQTVSSTATDPHVFKTASGTILNGYYADKKEIHISDTEGAVWIKEIEDNTLSYIGWTIYMKGYVVTDPALFGPGMFCPARQLMTCCIADVSIVGFTCRYDVQSSFAPIIRDGTWVMVTGTVSQGSYEGQPEPQLLCTSVKSATAPDDPYLYLF